LAVFDLGESMNAPPTNKCIFSAFQDRSQDVKTSCDPALSLE